MPIQIIEYAGRKYPAFQSEGNAAQWAKPFALHICQPDIKEGYDIGYCKDEWKLHPRSMGVDDGEIINAYHLPSMKVDYVFSSHCLEHLHDWVGALDHWSERIREGGVMFLYLPHPDQTYWQPWHNRKHMSVLYPKMLEQYFIDRGWRNVFVSERDLNYSYIAMAEKSGKEYDSGAIQEKATAL